MLPTAMVVPRMVTSVWFMLVLLLLLFTVMARLSVLLLCVVFSGVGGGRRCGRSSMTTEFARDVMSSVRPPPGTRNRKRERKRNTTAVDNHLYHETIVSWPLSSAAATPCVDETYREVLPSAATRSIGEKIQRKTLYFNHNSLSCRKPTIRRRRILLRFVRSTRMLRCMSFNI